MVKDSLAFIQSTNLITTITFHVTQVKVIMSKMYLQIECTTILVLNQLIHKVTPVIQIKPCEKWGSCHTEGFVFIANYQRNLDLTKGLYFDVYRSSAAEIYRIKYIVVDVDID